MITTKQENGEWIAELPALTSTGLTEADALYALSFVLKGASSKVHVRALQAIRRANLREYNEGSKKPLLERMKELRDIVEVRISDKMFEYIAAAMRSFPALSQAAVIVTYDPSNQGDESSAFGLAAVWEREGVGSVCIGVSEDADVSFRTCPLGKSDSSSDVVSFLDVEAELRWLVSTAMYRG